MKSVFSLVLAAFLPASAMATEVPELPIAMEELIVDPDVEQPDGFFAYDAADIDLGVIRTP
jgi:hypothetical protein